MSSFMICASCGVDTEAIHEYYMLKDTIWKQAVSNRRQGGILCIGCVEKRLGRSLTREDFASVPINSCDWIHRSPRLRAALMATTPPAPALPIK